MCGVAMNAADTIRAILAGKDVMQRLWVRALAVIALVVGIGFGSAVSADAASTVHATHVSAPVRVQPADWWWGP
jgi:hypothetical protein